MNMFELNWIETLLCWNPLLVEFSIYSGVALSISHAQLHLFLFEAADLFIPSSIAAVLAASPAYSGTFTF